MICRSGGGPAVAVRGVQLDIDLALTQDGARTLASGRAGTPSKDNRNLYLVQKSPDPSVPSQVIGGALDWASWARETGPRVQLPKTELPCSRLA